MPLAWIFDCYMAKGGTPSVVEQTGRVLKSTDTLASLVAPEYILVLVSDMLTSTPLEAVGPGQFHYGPLLGVAGLLIPVQNSHRAFLAASEELDFEDPFGLLDWFLVYHWLSAMLRRTTFGEGEKQYRVVAVQTYAMAYANVGSAVLANEMLITEGSVRGMDIAGGWSKDAPTPPWDEWTENLTA